MIPVARCTTVTALIHAIKHTGIISVPMFEQNRTIEQNKNSREQAYLVVTMTGREHATTLGKTLPLSRCKWKFTVYAREPKYLGILENEITNLCNTIRKHVFERFKILFIRLSDTNDDKTQAQTEDKNFKYIKNVDLWSDVIESIASVPSSLTLGGGSQMSGSGDSGGSL